VILTKAIMLPGSLERLLESFQSFLFVNNYTTSKQWYTCNELKRNRHKVGLLDNVITMRDLSCKDTGILVTCSSKAHVYFNYSRQHCAQRKAPVFKLLRGQF